MLGHSVSYYISQYWRNVPLYAEKLIPLLDVCLSNNFVYSDKVAGAFYELVNKYQHTDDLPLENLKEFIREQGYGYILDLMIQDEENIKLLWYLLVLIHQLKGSRDGLEVVLSLFQSSDEPDRESLLETLGEPTVTSVGGFLTNKGPNILTSPLTYVGACPMSSGGHIYYELPSSSYISTEGNYVLQFTNASIESLGKLNSIKITAHRANLTDTVLYENTNVPYSYPAKTYIVSFVQEAEASPIKSIEIEYTADYYGTRGMCLSGINIKRGSTTYLPVDGGTITTDDTFFTDNEAVSAFQIFNITNTTPINDGEITLKYDTELSAGTYTLDWNLLGGNDLTKYIKTFRIGVRYTDYDESESIDDTLSVFSSDELTYALTNKKYSVEFKALKPFNQIYVSYEISGDTSLITNVAKGIISGLGLYKDATTVTTKTIPNMIASTEPRGSVITNASFADEHEAFKLFNYTSVLGATPKSDGYIKYVYEENDRPVAGEYTFVWSNNSLDNNAYFKTVNAYVEYIDGTTQQISSQVDLDSVVEKTKYSFKFTSLKTIKSLTVNYTCQYNSEGEGGTFLEANITKAEDLETVSGINVWYENLPVATENTFTIESNIDVAKIGDEFFYNFKNFIRHYVYPELERLKVKYSLEGVQAQRIYNVNKIHYVSTLDRNKTLTVNTSPENATVTTVVNGVSMVGHSREVEVGSTVNYTVSCPYYYSTSGTATLNEDVELDVTLVEYDKYTTTFVAKDSVSGSTVTNAEYNLTSVEGDTSLNHITTHSGTVVNYSVSAPYYSATTGSITPTQNSTINVIITELPIYTVTLQPIDMLTQQALTDVTFSITSVEGSSSTNSISVHEGTTINYQLSKTNYETVYASAVVDSTKTITVQMSGYITVGQLNGRDTVSTVDSFHIRDFYN